MYLASCVHFRSFHAVTLLGQGLNVTNAAEVATAPITKAFPTFSGALIVVDALGSFGEFLALTYFFHFGIMFLNCLMEGHGQTGFHLNQLGEVVGRKAIQLNSLQSIQLNNLQSVQF